MADSTNENQIQEQPLRRMTSITRKLHHMMFRKKLAIYLGFDLLIGLIIFFGWILDQDVRELGHLSFDLHRSFSSTGGFWGIEYIGTDNGREVLRVNASHMFLFLIIVVSTLVAMQFIGIIIRWYGESKKIRQTLQPINDIALKADAMSRMTFSDAIYQTDGNADASFQRLEEAIANINPEQEAMPSLGDQELQGIEAAMNNLLRRMHESYQQQARFVNDASHELRTPIAVIQGYAGMLERWGREDEDVLNESITAISHEADHMNQLVEQLLFLARGDSGRTQLKQEPVELTDLMQEIYEESLMIDEKHPYRLKAPGQRITVTGDPMLLKQSIRILIDNAAKYTKEGDDITLSSGLNRDGEPFLQVQDSGIGMAQSDVEHMFERFYRSDEAREIKGTGLGLAIAKWIVDRHRGHFEILSRTELGTRIRMVLPKESIREIANIEDTREEDDIPMEETQGSDMADHYKKDDTTDYDSADGDANEDTPDFDSADDDANEDMPDFDPAEEENAGSAPATSGPSRKDTDQKMQAAK